MAKQQTAAGKATTDGQQARRSNMANCRSCNYGVMEADWREGASSTGITSTNPRRYVPFPQATVPSAGKGGSGNGSTLSVEHCRPLNWFGKSMTIKGHMRPGSRD